MTRPTPAALAIARSSLPARRVASTGAALARPAFANLLNGATAQNAIKLKPAAMPWATKPAASYNATMQPGHAMWAGGTAGEVTRAPGAAGGALAAVSRSEILATAQQLLGVPYVWGGTSATGLDCSAFVSKAWGVGRLTTDNLATVSQPITKDELKAGDVLNLTTSKDPGGGGHVRLFEGWANADHTRMSVFEETPPRSIHHVINWDAHYTPMRRNNVIDA